MSWSVQKVSKSDTCFQTGKFTVHTELFSLLLFLVYPHRQGLLINTAHTGRFSSREVSTQVMLTLVLRAQNPACFPTIDVLPAADYMNQVCSINQKLEGQRSQAGKQAGQADTDLKKERKHVFKSKDLWLKFMLKSKTFSLKEGL